MHQKCTQIGGSGIQEGVNASKILMEMKFGRVQLHVNWWKWSMGGCNCIAICGNGAWEGSKHQYLQKCSLGRLKCTKINRNGVQEGLNALNLMEMEPGKVQMHGN